MKTQSNTTGPVDEHQDDQKILQALREAYPDHEVLAEEGGLSGPGGPGREYQWIVERAAPGPG